MAHDDPAPISIESRLELTPGARRRRRFIRWSIWLVVLAAVVAGAAANFPVLVMARASQGAFGALLASSALALLTTTFPSSSERWNLPTPCVTDPARKEWGITSRG